MGVVSGDLFPEHRDDLAMILECPERAEREPIAVTEDELEFLQSE